MALLIGEASRRFGRYLDPAVDGERKAPEIDFNFISRQLTRAPAFWQRSVQTPGKFSLLMSNAHSPLLQSSSRLQGKCRS